MAKKSKKGSFFWLLGVSFLAVGLLVFCQFFYGDGVGDKTLFYQGTHINGVDVSGMTRKQAEAAVSEKILSDSKNIEVTLTSGDKKWVLTGDDFECGGLEKPIAEVMNYGRSGNVFTKKKVANKIKNDGMNFNISYSKILSADGEIDKIVSEVEGESPKIEFKPDQAEMFSVSSGRQVKVDREALSSALGGALNEVKATIAIPLAEMTPEFDCQGLINQIKLRSSFKTSYATSSEARKHNVRKALSCFNGMIVEPGEEVSFNQVTGARTVENGYKTANIIVGGVYKAGVGGGVCQASTTLYNALLLSGIDIVQVNHHSLPASYVPLSFDAMVSEGYADLVFRNNLGSPIYIKTFGDETYANVEIYGQALDEGEQIRTRVELVRVLPHSGDKIVPDSGEYSNKVLYKGEYYRLKYPREGYESRGYLQHIKDGVIEEKLLRHDIYKPQSGLIVEGVENIGEGMSVPPSDVKIIPAQKITDETTKNVKSRIEKDNPSEYNP